MKIGYQFWLDYGHSLKGHPKCGRKHGHTAKILIEIEGTIKGGPTYRDHMLMDFDDMKKTCKSVLDQLDHNDLDAKFEFPSSENIAQWIFHELAKQLPVSRVTFYEGNGKWCTIER